MATRQTPPAQPDVHTRSRALNSYLAEHAGGEGVLGALALLSVGTVEPVTHDELSGWFTELNLATRFLPKPPRQVDAYERATSPGRAKVKYPLGGTTASGRKKQKFDATGKTVTLMMRHVLRDETRIVRHLVREMADHADVTLSYEVKLAEAEFLRQVRADLPEGSGDMELTTEDAEIEALEAAERNAITELITQIETDYATGVSHITGTRIAKCLRDYLESSLGAIRIQNGVYFVPDKHAEKLGALRELAGRCGASITRVPLPDTSEQREMVAEAFDAKIAADLDSLSRDITREKTDGAAPYRVAKLHKRFLAMQRDAAEYQDNLDAEIGDTSARLAAINAQIADLLVSVDVDDMATR
ncbi:hypothetical protein DMC63_37825 [Streptomyces sp. WAC 05977]|nr:hypothetical protein DMC63_37825 [Streptomyces sp. WAC 05977]